MDGRKSKSDLKYCVHVDERAIDAVRSRVSVGCMNLLFKSSVWIGSYLQAISLGLATITVCTVPVIRRPVTCAGCNIAMAGPYLMYKLWVTVHKDVWDGRIWFMYGCTGRLLPAAGEKLLRMR